MEVSPRANWSWPSEGLWCRVSGVQFRGGGGHGRRTFLEVLLLGLAAHPRHTGHGLDVALAHRGRVQDRFGCPGQAHGQPSGAKQDPGHPWGRGLRSQGRGTLQAPPTLHFPPFCYWVFAWGLSLRLRLLACIQGSWGSQVDEWGVPWASPLNPTPG